MASEVTVSLKSVSVIWLSVSEPVEWPDTGALHPLKIQHMHTAAKGRDSFFFILCITAPFTAAFGWRY